MEINSFSLTKALCRVAAVKGKEILCINITFFSTIFDMNISFLLTSSFVTLRMYSFSFIVQLYPNDNQKVSGFKSISL